MQERIRGRGQPAAGGTRVGMEAKGGADGSELRPWRGSGCNAHVAGPFPNIASSRVKRSRALSRSVT